MLAYAETQISKSLEEALRFVDELLKIGDLEQKCIISLKFAELNEQTAKKEKLFAQNREFLLNVESMVDRINNDKTLRKETSLRKLCQDLTQRAQLLKLQISENMSILNQIKTFFARFMTVDNDKRSYNTFGHFGVPQSKNCRSLISRKV